MPDRWRWRELVVLIAVVLTTAACGRFPRDPDGTLERIEQSHVLRAGASYHPPFVEQGDPPTGSEVELVTAYANHLGADVEWLTGTEAVLVERMESGELDVIVAGLDESTPWADKVGLTRAYAELASPGEAAKPRVIAVPMGENALLVDLECWLDENAGTA